MRREESYREGVDHTCAKCGAGLSVGRFCLNCGHRIGEPVSSGTPTQAERAPVEGVDWNPAEDLLPYDDSYDDERDAPLSGNAWVAWVVGAAVLLMVVFVVLALVNLGDSEEPTASPSDDLPLTQQPGDATEVSPADPQLPQGTGKPFDAASSATVKVPSSAPATTDLDGQLATYTADNMHDGIRSTAWRMAGDGTGSTITIRFAEPVVVSRVGLINGYTKRVSGVDWYPNNRRIMSAQWGFDDGSTLDQIFTEGKRLQRAKVPGVVTSTLTLTITSVTPPGTGELGRDYTAISELAVIGQRVD